jgi:hypothetical protein
MSQVVMDDPATRSRNGLALRGGFPRHDNPQAAGRTSAAYSAKSRMVGASREIDDVMIAPRPW